MVERAEVLRGEQAGYDVLAEASARRPAFRMRGPRELLARLRAAKPGDRVVLSGYTRSGSFDLDVSEVVVTPPSS